VLDQVRGALRHAPRPARGAKPAPFATERQELVVAAVGAAQAQEAVCQDATLQERVELVFDELGQASAKGLFGLGEEALGVLLHQALQRGLLGAVALVVDLGAIAMRPAGRAGVGLHVMGAGSLGWCSFSRRARQSIRHRGDIHAQNHGGDPEAVRLGPRALGRLDQENRKRLSTAARSAPLTQDARGSG